MRLSHAAGHAVVEGLSTGLPISASAHRFVARIWLGDDSGLVALSALAEVGCLMALAIVVRRRLFGAATEGLRGIARPTVLGSSEGGRDALTLVLAALVSAGIDLALRSSISATQGTPMVVGAGLLLGAASLSSTILAPAPSRLGPGPWGAMLVGLAHGMAIMPGASRIGAAFVILRWLGVGEWRAAETAMMVSVPVMALGGARFALQGAGVGTLPAALMSLVVVLALVSASIAAKCWRALCERKRSAWLALWLVPLALAVLGYGRALPDPPSPVRSHHEQGTRNKGQRTGIGATFTKIMPSELTYALIMAGGSGTRFWPASRKLRPKQLLALGPSGMPLLRETVERVVPICGWEHVLIATGRHLEAATRELLPELEAEQLLVEPCAKNTAPCIGWAAATVARTDPEAVVIAVPSDPFIGDGEVFVATLRTAVASARGGTITTIGITPSHPETGYGYIEVDPAVPALLDVRRVRRFVEKPDLARAKEYVDAGNFYWNAGMFFFRACDMLAAIHEHMPELSEDLRALDSAAAQGREADVLGDVFARLPAKSIDFGVMEHVRELACVPGSFGWSDLGSWRSVSDLARKDAAGNHAPTDSVLIDATGNYVLDLRSSDSKRVVALLGVNDLVIVETDDALLVMPLSEAQRVREVVEALEKRGDEELV